MSLCNLLPNFIQDFAFKVAEILAALDDTSLGSQACFPNWAKKLNLEIHGGEGLFVLKSTGKSHTHGGVRKATENSALQSAHGIGMLRLSVKGADGPPFTNVHDTYAKQVFNRSGRYRFLLDQRMNLPG
jgi:hypothetical protein